MSALVAILVYLGCFAYGDCWCGKLRSFLRGQRSYFGPWKRITK